MSMEEQFVLRQLTCIREEHGLNVNEGLVTLADVFRFFILSLQIDSERVTKQLVASDLYSGGDQFESHTGHRFS